MHGYVKNIVKLLLYAMVPFVIACSTTPHLNVINDGDSVTILSPNDALNDNTLNIHNQAIGKGAAMGGATGALGGAIYGLTCGPFFIICSPIGALAGAVVGIGTGAVVGTTQSLDTEQAAQAHTKISDYLQKNNPQGELLARVIIRAENLWQIKPPPAERTLVVQFDSVGLRTKNDADVVLVLQATVTVHFPDRTGKQQARIQKFEYEGSPTYIDSWLDNKEEFLQLRFNDAYQTLAENIVIALSNK